MYDNCVMRVTSVCRKIIVGIFVYALVSVLVSILASVVQA